MTAVGTANPNPHGHAMTSTEMAKKSAKIDAFDPEPIQLAGIAPTAPSIDQTINVTNATQTTKNRQNDGRLFLLLL